MLNFTRLDKFFPHFCTENAGQCSKPPRKIGGFVNSIAVGTRTTRIANNMYFDTGTEQLSRERIIGDPAGRKHQ